MVAEAVYDFIEALSNALRKVSQSFYLGGRSQESMPFNQSFLVPLQNNPFRTHSDQNLQNSCLVG